MTNYSNEAQQQVAEFQKTFGHPAPNEPTVLELDRVVGRSSWGSGEEMVELIHASSKNEKEFKDAFVSLLQGLRTAYQKQVVKEFPTTKEDRLVAQADAIADHLYFVMGDAVEAGIDIGKVMTIVNDANMSKLFTDENGNKYVKTNESGKIMKSPEFEPPEEKIKLEVLRQIEESKVVAQQELKPKKKSRKAKGKEEPVGDIGEEFIDHEEVNDDKSKEYVALSDVLEEEVN